MKTQTEQDQQDSLWLGDAQGIDKPDPLTYSLDRLYRAGPQPEFVSRALDRLNDTLPKPADLTVFYGEIPESPVGRILIAVSNAGIFAVDFGGSEGRFIDRLHKRGRKEVVRSDRETAIAKKQVREYLDGLRLRFEMPVDLSGLTGFQRDVLTATSRIPPGQVSTYGEIARLLGKPRSSRAVGRALGSNPVPIVVPCHRVIGSDGSLGGYSGGGGVRSKAFLLKLEGAQLVGI